MSDNNYNDIIPSNGNYRPDDYRPSHKKSSNGRLIRSLIAILVLVLIGLVLLIYFKFSGKSEKNKQKQQKTTVSATTPILSDKPADIVAAPKHGNDIQAVTISSDIDEVGEVLLRYHILTAGETIETVAELYGLDVRTIKSVNRNTDMPGVLRIPTRDGMMYTVKEGDTLMKIISKYRLNLTAKQLSQVNGISETDALAAGSELFIPLI